MIAPFFTAGVAARSFPSAPRLAPRTGLSRVAMSTSAEHFSQLVHARYACKAFDPSKPVDDGALRACLELAQRAPTSFNTQPWVAIVVKGADAKATLSEALAEGNRPKLESAPAAIVFAADMEPEKLLTEATPDFVRNALPLFMEQCTTPEAWAFKQTSFAAGTFMLAATAHGLQTCPMEGFASSTAVRDAVGLPARYAVPLVVAVGHELEPPAKRSPRFDLSSQVFVDTFGQH